MDEQSEGNEESDVSNNISVKSDVISYTDEINDKVQYDSDDYSNPDQNPVSEFDLEATKQFHHKLVKVKVMNQSLKI